MKPTGLIVLIAAVLAGGWWYSRQQQPSLATAQHTAATPVGSEAKAVESPPVAAVSEADADKPAKSRTLNDLLSEIQSSTNPVALLLKHLPAARSGDGVSQYLVATILKLCINVDDSRGKSEKLVRDALATSKDPARRADLQSQIDTCAPIWQLPADEAGERADWLRQSADAGVVPALFEAATDKAIDQSLEQRNARVQQALDSRDSTAASFAAMSLYLEETVPDGNLLDYLPYLNQAVMRSLLAGCALGEDCSMESASVQAYCRQTACPPAKDLIDLFSRQLSPAEYEEARLFADSVVTDLKVGRIRADIQAPGKDDAGYDFKLSRPTRADPSPTVAGNEH